LLLLLLLLAHLLLTRLAWRAGIMETEVLHVRFVIVEVEGKIRCCDYAMNRAMVVDADFRGQEVTEGARLTFQSTGDLHELQMVEVLREVERPLLSLTNDCQY